MPDLIRFSYIPKSEFQTSQSDATQSDAHSSSGRKIGTEAEHVLVLDFTDSFKGAKSKTGYICFHFFFQSDRVINPLQPQAIFDGPDYNIHGGCEEND